MDLFNYSPDTLLSFFLTLFRCSLLIFLLPFFGGESVPKTVKPAVCLVMAVALFPYLHVPGSLFPSHPFTICIMLLGEITLGLVLGLVMRFLFAAVQTGGQLIGFQMGFAMVSAIDPDTGVQEAVTSHFLYMVSLLTFLSLDGHLIMLSGLAQSFKMVPPGSLFLSPQLTEQILAFSANIFVLAVKIASPVMVALFMVDLALALVGRAAPQMNILIIGFPLKISVGMFFFGLLFTTLSMYIEQFITHMPVMFYRLLDAAHI
ncbi:MAG: flagellar biosynthetic protein FliR [Desulfovibrionaceae bacterium]